MSFHIHTPGRLVKILVSAIFPALLSVTPVFAQEARTTSTPIKHVVVIFQENVSFDHYFATYPKALNRAGEPRFVARRGTPTVNGLSGALLTTNPNKINPFRIDRNRAATCDQDHDYKDEQAAMNHGALDKFVETVGTGPGVDGTLVCKATDVMGYFDGNTVTAIWNYAQHFAMNDNSFGTTYGPSTPGVLNLISGQTHGSTPTDIPGDNAIAGSIVGDPRPVLDDCSPGGGGRANQVLMSGRNIGDLLNAKGITWGFFQGGFKPTATVGGKAICGATHTGSDGRPRTDYIPHHQGFQYYRSTANPHHLPPSSVANIGKTDQANHQYDIADFFEAIDAGNFPEVVYLKAPGFQDGHAGYSDPLAEQEFLVTTINRLQQLRAWRDTAVILAYDDSDGWYDHVMPPLVTPSNTAADVLTAPGSCGTSATGTVQGKCGFGPRLPLVVISPFAKHNFVDSTLTDQSSILRFIEDNFKTGRIGGDAADQRAGTLLNMFDFRRDRERDRKLVLDPNTGQVVSGHSDDGDDD
ncbi:MAG TPA: alkaline phosphatase family protein [Candidatus Saccharimonadales bacterium]|nr:alkaline phosphatase family protein [Candidatus Saccharimonadales bacterium]